MKKYFIALIFSLLALNSCVNRLDIDQWGSIGRNFLQV